MYNQIKATAISIKPKKWDKVGNADKVERFFRLAAKERPDLILTTEGVLEGYVVMDVLEGRRSAQDVHDIAEPIDGPYIQRFQRLARELGTCLCFGFAERIGDNVYNTAVFIDSEGEISGKYHKVQLAEGTHPSCNYNRVGDTLRAFDTPLGRVGIVICNDRWNPMIVRALALDGARLLLISSYGSKAQEQNDTVLARSRENGIPIVEANVGMNLIVNKGEIAAYQWGNDKITTAMVDIPATPSTVAAREYEQEYLRLQGPEMARRYEESLKRIKGEQHDGERAGVGQLLVDATSAP
jgi:predicted amidohydrolase